VRGIHLHNGCARQSICLWVSGMPEILVAMTVIRVPNGQTGHLRVGWFTVNQLGNTTWSPVLGEFGTGSDSSWVGLELLGSIFLSGESPVALGRPLGCESPHSAETLLR
jgi:hypothetical protein